MLIYKNSETSLALSIDDFVDSPDPNWCDYITLSHAQSICIDKDKDTNSITFVIIQNPEMNQLEFSLDGNVVKVDPACGFNIYRNGNHFVLHCYSFPL